MICGHCKEDGPGVTIAHVRGCSGVPGAPAVPVTPAIDYQVGSVEGGSENPYDWAESPQKWSQEEGTFRYKGEPVRVRLAVHGSKKLYASRLEEVSDKKDSGTTRFKWAFTSGLISEMERAQPGSVVKMTMDEAIEFGKLYGQCIRCGRILTKDTSIAQAMGDICAGAF